MTTPLIPTSTQLNATKYTPAELIEDQEFEAFLFALPLGQGLDFIRDLMQAYRQGNPSFTFSFNNNSNAAYAAEKLSKAINSNGYGYAVAGPGASPDNTIIITF